MTDNNVFNSNKKNKIFSEIAIKSRIDYTPFKHYFYQNKDEYSVHNSFQISDDKFVISGFVLLKLFSDYSIKFMRIAQAQKSSYIELKLDNENMKKLEQLVEFYHISEDKTNSVLTEIKMNRVHFDCMIIVQDILEFYEKFSSYFSEIDNYFKMNESDSKLGCSSFLILSLNSSTTNKYNTINQINNQLTKIPDLIEIGDEITTLSSNLAVISYDHFSKSYSKGIIGNIISKNLLMLDVRVLPNSHGAIIYKNINSQNEMKFPVAIILPILNVKYSYTPIIFAFKLNSLIKIILDIYEKNAAHKIKKESIPMNNLNKLVYNLSYNKPRINLNNTVFIIYNLSNYATCFYIGNGRFLTNKHFFSNDNQRIYIKNYNLDAEVIILFIPDNNLDIAVVKIADYEVNREKYDRYLTKIKLSNNKPYILQPITCVGFSYFNKREILSEIKYPNQAKGILSKIITKQGEFHTHMIYQVDCSCFSGGSGGPVVDENGCLVGVLFQNLSFHSSDNYLQLPNSGFLIAQDIIELIINSLNKNEDLSKLWIFTMNNEEVDLYFNYRKMTPKF